MKTAAIIVGVGLSLAAVGFVVHRASSGPAPVTSQVTAAQPTPVEPETVMIVASGTVKIDASAAAGKVPNAPAGALGVFNLSPNGPAWEYYDGSNTFQWQIVLMGQHWWRLDLRTQNRIFASWRADAFPTGTTIFKCENPVIPPVTATH